MSDKRVVLSCSIHFFRFFVLFVSSLLINNLLKFCDFKKLRLQEIFKYLFLPFLPLFTQEYTTKISTMPIKQIINNEKVNSCSFYSGNFFTLLRKLCLITPAQLVSECNDGPSIVKSVAKYRRHSLKRSLVAF